MSATEYIFYFFCSVVVYALFGYPLLTLVLAWMVNRRVEKRSVTPSISFVIAAYNEEAVIAKKLEQTLALDYPPDNLQIIVASDGSTDGTDEIARSFRDRGVTLYQTQGRLGKTQTLNESIAACATGDILVFSDATGEFNRECLRRLAENFADTRVGCVTGRVAYRYGSDANSKGFGFYQRFAVAVRRAESRFGSQTSVSGSIHAMRRQLYQPANPAYSLDVVNAVNTVSGGYRVVYESEAVSLEKSRTTLSGEFRCRVRIAIRCASMMPFIFGQLANPRHWSYLFQMVSHKVLRWWLWVSLLVALVSNLVLAMSSAVFAGLATLQVGFYVAAVVGLVAARIRVTIPLLSTPAFFVMGIAAQCIGAIKAIKGITMPSWEPVR